MMSLPDFTTVLIVGAGPTGLTAALSLLHCGLHDLVIVDAVQHGENTSRAFVIHAATLEVTPSLPALPCLTHFQRRWTSLGVQTTLYLRE